MSRIFTLAIKDLRLLIRDRFGLFWVIAFPLLMALFFGAIFSGGGSGSARALKVAFIGDGTESANGFRDKFGKAEVIDLVEMTADSARDAVTQGKLVAYVKYEDTSATGAAFFGGGKPVIEVGIDPSRRAESGYLQGLVNQAYFASLQETMMNPAKMQRSIADSRSILESTPGISDNERKSLMGFLNSLDTLMSSIDADTATASTTDTTAREAAQDFSPFSQPDIEYVDIAVAQTGPRSSWEITFPQAIQWALIGVAAAFGISMVIERTRGTLLRLRLAPITRAHILGGKGLACFIACLVVTGALILFGVLVFGVRIASPLNLVLALLGAGVCFVGLMMLISVLGKTENAVAGAGWALLLVMAMTGGGMVPLIAMPGFMRTLSHVSPVKWSVTAFEGAIWRGFTLPQMLEPVGILVAVGIVSFSIGVIIMMRTDR